MKINKIKNMAFTTVFVMTATTASAATIGSDTNLKLSPTAGGMAGAGYINPQDAVASVYGNQASLTQLEGDTDFTFAATYLNVRNEAKSDGTGFPGQAYDAEIEMENYLLPSIAFRQRLSDKVVLGGGLNVISGLGSDYRTNIDVQPSVTYINFGANAAAAYELSPRTSIGASMTLAYSLLEVGLVSNSSIQEAFGVRGGLGFIHDLGPVKVGLNYNSKLELDFDNVVRTSPGVMSDLTLEQPQELILGVSTTPELWSDVMLEANLIYKNWDAAETYEDIWRDTYTLQLGGQYVVTDKLKLRAGYSISTRLLKKNLDSTLGGLSTLEAGGSAVPLSPGALQFVQATLADPAWSNNITVGLGYDFTDKLTANLHAGYGWGPDRTLGSNKIEVGIISAGAGLTWNF